MSSLHAKKVENYDAKPISPTATYHIKVLKESHTPPLSNSIHLNPKYDEDDAFATLFNAKVEHSLQSIMTIASEKGNQITS